MCSTNDKNCEGNESVWVQCEAKPYYVFEGIKHSEQMALKRQDAEREGERNDHM